MFFSLAILLQLGHLAGLISQKIGLPALIGMMGAGMFLGPYGINLLSQDLLHISPEIRKFALVIILLRAGFQLLIPDIKKMGKSASLMAFVPATMEWLGALLVAPLLLGFSWLQAGLSGAILAAVSPAVVVPAMLGLIEAGWGQKRRVPQLVLLGASLDDVYVIVIFTLMMQMAQGHSVGWLSLLSVPVSIFTGMGIGWGLGWALGKAVNQRPALASQILLLVLSTALFLVGIETQVNLMVPFSALLAVMFLAMSMTHYRQMPIQPLQNALNQLWQFASILLFGLVGASVNPRLALKTGPLVILLILIIMAFRMLGVWLALVGSSLNMKEKLFAMIAYSPKATVQAAIGGLPLAAGIEGGDLILVIAVSAILITAPIGAWAIEWAGPRLLEKTP